MSTQVKAITEMLDMLPETEQNLALELVKRIVLAWDPDYTKVTPSEASALQEAEKNFENGEYYTDSEINWD